MTPTEYDRLYVLLNVEADLDPKFEMPYLLGGLVLGESTHHARKALRVLGRGKEQYPADWRFPFYMGYTHYFSLGETETAGKAMAEAAQLPGSPAYLPGLASRMLSEAKDPGKALAMLETIVRQESDPLRRAVLERRIREVTVERDLQALEWAVESYREKMGAVPRELSDLVRAGILPGIPAEPNGGRYVIERGGKGAQRPGHAAAPGVPEEMIHEKPILVIEGLSKSYPTGFWRKPVRVLSDLSCEVRENEIVGFLGPNGAGKTTTIKILNRLAFPDAGKVTLFGGQVRDGADVRRRIGFMPEQPYFYEYLTGGEFLRLCGQLCGMSRADTESRSSELLARVGLSGARDTAIRKYSKGMMQRLGLAQALLHDPELVILDEPMSGLDPMGRMEVRGIIRDLKAAGKTVFFSSHILSDVEALCDRVIMLHKGRKVAEGRVEELIGAETLYIELVVSPVLPRGPARGGGDSSGRRIRRRALSSCCGPRTTGRRTGGSRVFCGRGVHVLSCVPVKKNLEEIFMERVGNPGATGTAS